MQKEGWHTAVTGAAATVPLASPRPLSVDLAARRHPRGDRIKTLQPVYVVCCMSPLMAHRVISLPRSSWVAFGAKRTLTSAGHARDLWVHAQVQRVAAPRVYLACIVAIWVLGIPAMWCAGR